MTQRVEIPKPSVIPDFGNEELFPLSLICEGMQVYVEIVLEAVAYCVLRMEIDGEMKERIEGPITLPQASKSWLNHVVGLMKGVGPLILKMEDVPNPLEQ